MHGAPCPFARVVHPLDWRGTPVGLEEISADQPAEELFPVSDKGVLVEPFQELVERRRLSGIGRGRQERRQHDIVRGKPAACR